MVSEMSQLPYPRAMSARQVPPHLRAALDERTRSGHGQQESRLPALPAAKMIETWEALRAFALRLGLPRVEDATSWGNPVLKAYGKFWCWWSPYIEAGLFKCDKDERDMLRAVDPETFPFHAHYEVHNLILVSVGRIDPDWAEVRLIRTWREMAPQQFLKAWDAEHG